MAWSTEEISQLDLKLCREVLAEEQAKLFDSLDSTVTPHVGTGVEELNRCWVEGVADRWSMLRRYLEIFGASKNTAPSNIVVDPIASMEVHKGVYRQAFIRRLQRNGITYIVQTLRRGLMQSPRWDEARIFQDRQLRGNSSSVPGVSDTTSDTPEKYVYVEFFGIDPDHEVSFVSGLTSDTYTDPSVGGQTLSGEWHNLGLALEPADDGTLTGRLLLARPQYTLKAFSDIGGTNESDVFYLWNVPKTIAQQVLDDYKALAIPGSTATASYNTNQGVVDIILRKKKSEDEGVDFGTIGRACSYFETATVTYNVADPSAVQMPSESLTLTTNIGITYRREVTNNGDGTYNVVIIRRERITQGPLTFNAEVSFGRNISAKETRGWKTGYDAYNAAYPQTSPPVGTTYSRDVRINEDCSLDIVDRTIVITPLQRSGYQKTALGIIRVSVGVENGSDEDSETIENYDPNIGETSEYDERVNPDGSITYTRTISTPIELTSSSEINTIIGSLQSGVVIQNLNRGELLPDPPATPLQGETIEFKKTQGPDGLWNTEETKITSPVLETYEKTETIKSLAEEIGEQNRRDPMPVPTAPTIGKRVRFRRQENRDGTWTYTEIIEDSAPDGATLKGRVYEVASCRTLSEAEVERNIAEDLLLEDPGTPDAGVTRVVRLTENPDGSWDREVINRTAPELTTTEYLVRNTGNATTTITTGQTGAEPAAPTYEQGKTKTLRVEQQPDCSFVKTEREQDAEELEITERVIITHGGLERTTSTGLTGAAPTAPTAEEGVTKTHRVEESPDGSFTETLSEETSPELTNTGTSVDGDATSEREEQINKRGGPGSEADPGGNKLFVASNRQNPDGTYTHSMEVVTPVPISESISFVTRGRSATVTSMVNQEIDDIQAVATALNGNNINNVNLSKSRFPNLWNAIITSVVPDVGGGGSGTPVDRLNTSFPVTIRGITYTVKIVTSYWESRASAAFAGGQVIVEGLPRPGLYYRGRGVWQGIGVVVV